jgi:hypothetical protein
MLSLEVPPRTAAGLLVFADHLDPGHFYYAAPDPRIAMTAGRPMFDVFSYAVELEHSPLSGTKIPDELGAGFLTMGVECSVPPAKLQQARTELANQLGRAADTVTLGPIPYVSGSVSVIALDAASGAAAAAATNAPVVPGRPTFVQQIVGAGTPSLLGDLRSIFSLSLSQEGVAFLQGLYTQGAAPVGVVYDLKFLGLRPSVHAEIHADVSRIYSEFGGKASVGYLQYFRAEVEKTISKLQQDGAVTIKITTEAVGEEGQKAAELALSLFKDKIIQELFRPTAAPQIPNLGNIPGLNAMSSQPQSIVALSLRAKTEEELRTIDFDFSMRAPAERTHAPQGFVTALLTPEQMRDRIHHVDLGSPFFELLEVLVSGPSEEEFAALRLRSVTAELRYGTDPPQSLVFRPGSSGDKTWAVKRLGRPSLAYTVDLTYEFSRDGSVDGDGLTYRTGPRERTGRTFSIRPYDDVTVIDVEVERGRLPESVADVDVTLDYAGTDFTAHHRLRLPRATVLPLAQRQWQVRTRDAGAQTYTAAATLTFDDGAVLELPAVTSGERLLRVDAPFAATRNLLVQPTVTATDVSAISLEVVYEDGDYRRTFAHTFTPPWQPLTLSWPIMDGTRQKLRYRVTTAAGGIVTPTDWETTDEPSIVVGDVGRRRRSVDIRLIGPPMADAGLDAVNVRVGIAGSADADAVSVFFDPSTPTAQSVSLPAPPGAPPGFRYQTTGFHADGTQRQSAWLDGPTPLLVVSTRSV